MKGMRILPKLYAARIKSLDLVAAIATSAKLDAAGSKYGEKGNEMRLLSKSVMVFALTLLISLFMYGGWFAPERAQAALEYVGGASATGTAATYNVSLTGLTGGIGSAAQAGDLVVVVTGWASAADGNPGVTTAGYTEVYDGYANDTRDANLSVNWKIMGGTPDTLVTVSGFNNAANGGATVVHVWRGADQGTPMDVAAPSAPLGVSAINASRPNSPAITPVTAGAVVIAVGLGTGPAAPTAMTEPTGFINGLSATGGGSTMGVVANIASQVWAGGSVDPVAWTGGLTSTNDCWVAGTLAIRPALLVDTISVTVNTAIATVAAPLATGVQMQMLQVDCNNTGDSNCAIESITVDDLGTAGATDISNLHIYIDTDSVFAGAVGPITQAGFNGSSTPVSLLSWTTERIISNGTSKYIWIVYDLAAGADGKSIQSSVTSIAVDTPDVGATGTWSANVVNVSSGPSSTINSCSGCHGNPPVDNTGGIRDATEGTFAGDHEKHNYACDTCHDSLPGAYGHRNGSIEFKAGTIGYSDDGTYNGGVAVAQTNNPSLSTCDNVNCHGNNNTGVWGGAGYTSCTTSLCHGFPPSTNAHQQHYTSKAGQGWVTGDYAFCVACHPDDSANHMDRTDGVVDLANLTKSGSGTTITCSNISATGCHNGNPSPQWGSSGITCTNCHAVGGTNSATVANPVSGLHGNSVASVQDHDNNLTGTCEVCHDKAALKLAGHWNGIASLTSDYNAAQVGIGAMYTDAGGTGATRGSCFGTSSLSSCHSDKGNWRRAWSTDADVDSSVTKLPGQAVCNVCHGQFSGIGSSTGWNEGTVHYRSGIGAAENKGAIHTDAGDECEDCHAYDSVSAGHNNNNQIDFSDGGGAIYTVILNTDRWYCASTCHNTHLNQDPLATDSRTFLDSLAFPNSVNHVTGGDSTPTGSCYTCHGDGVASYWPNSDGTNDGAATENDAGAHKLHMAWLAKKVYTTETLSTLLIDNGNGASDTKQKALCIYCHDLSDVDHMGATKADVFVSAPKRFQDGAVETTAGGAVLGTFNDGTNICSNVDCHAQYGTVAVGSEPVATPSWYAAPTHTVALASLPTTMNCAACHINPTTDPNHTEHTGANTTFGISITCARCHSNGPIWGTPTGTLPSAGHLDGTFNLVGSASLSYAGAFRTSFGSCGTNVCHNNGTSTTAGTPNASGYAWGDAITNCTECHLGAMTSNAHLEHSTANGYSSSPCNECHSLETAGTHIDSNLNFNTAKVTYSTASAGVVSGLRANGSQAGTCLTSGCHNKSATPSVAWNTTGFLTCNSCHGDASSGLSAAHADHITAGKTCSQCHADPITDETHISIKTTLINGATADTGEASVPFSNAAALVKYTYNPTEHSCYTPTGQTPLGIGCHASAGYSGVTDPTRPNWDTTINGATTCIACHTNTTTANLNPTRGLHSAAGILTSSTPHDDSFAGSGTCTTCHTAVPALGGAHINGLFTADDALANNEYYTFAAYTDAAANSGTCSGTSAPPNGVNAGCHDSIFDGGTWARKWSTVAYNGDGTQCAVCHGGFNNDWTFGSAANTTDLAVSHTYDWNPAAESNNIIGTHLNNTTNATKCNICHVYGDPQYNMTWGLTGNHGNDKITMNSINSTNTYNGTAFTCSNTCHSDNSTGHAMEASASPVWSTRGEMLAGPSLTCTSCHTGSGTGALKVGSSSSHVVRGTKAGMNTFNSCNDCHPEHTGGVLVPNNTTVGISYTQSGRTGFRLGGIATTGATEAEICWNCHNNTTTYQATAISEWGANTKQTGAPAALNPYDYGTISTPNWTTATWYSAQHGGGTGLFAYKSAAIKSTHTANSAGSSTVTITAGYASESVDSVGNIRCSYCHDVHDTASGVVTGDVAGKPFLRGTWWTNPYKEDGAPATTSTTYYAAGNFFGGVPRGWHSTALPANTSLLGGWQIDQNNNNPTVSTGYTGVNWTTANSSGLCALCHTGSVDAMNYNATENGGGSLWVGTNGHSNAVIGGTGSARSNIYNPTTRNEGTSWTNPKMGYQMNATGGANGSDRMYGVRNYAGNTFDTTTYPGTNITADNNLGVSPYAVVGTNAQVRYAYEAGRGSTFTGVWGVDQSTTTAQTQYHKFSCSKCHNPHASRLPKLMITNCLDISHNSWDDLFSGDIDWTSGAANGTVTNWSTVGIFPTGTETALNNKEFAYAKSAQNCHRFIDNNGNGTITTGDTGGDEPGWNKVTPWK